MMPEYVVVGEWVDPRPREPWERPRSHPFGPEAWQAIGDDGEFLIFPSREAFIEWKKRRDARPK